MEFKKLIDYVEENKVEHLENELTVACKECDGFGYVSENNIDMEPCENCCTEGTISRN